MSSIADVLTFLAELRLRRIHFQLSSYREAIMVEVAVPGERWEVEFFESGDPEIEVFRSDGGVKGPVALQELLERAAEDAEG